jgi:hypothetical protein
MDMLDMWAVKIAEVAAPNEVPLAPLTIRAYINGGEERADLFRSNKKGTAGGFDFGGFQAVFPLILQALTIASPILTSILSSVVSDLFLTALKNRLSKHDNQQDSTTINTLADDPYKPLKYCIAILSKELQDAKIPRKQADLIVYRILVQLLEEPESANLFIQRISEPPHATKKH